MNIFERRDERVRGLTALAADPEPEPVPEVDWLEGISSFRSRRTGR
jgi:hypothetical protein